MYRWYSSRSSVWFGRHNDDGGKNDNGGVDAVRAPVRTVDACTGQCTSLSARHPIIISFTYKIHSLYAGCRPHAHARAETIADARADRPTRLHTHVHTETHVTRTHTNAYTHWHTLTQTHHHTDTAITVRCETIHFSFLSYFISFLLFPDRLLFRTLSAPPVDHAFSGHRPRQVARTSVNNAQATAPDFFNMSSWQDYVDKHLLASRCVTKAAIAGHDGNVWAKSDGFDVSINSSYRLTVCPSLQWWGSRNYYTI